MMKSQNESNNPETREQKTVSIRGFFWRRIYRDKRFLIVAFLIAVFLVTYLMTGDYTWRPQGSWGRTVETSDKRVTNLPSVTAEPSK